LQLKVSALLYLSSLLAPRQVDNRKQKEPLLTPDEAISVCNRNFGVGGDGVIFLLPPEKGSGAEYGMRIFNSDGSEPEVSCPLR